MSGSLVRSVRNVCFILRTTFPLQFPLFVTRLQIGIGKLLDVRAALKSSINAGQECRMLRVSNDFRFFFLREISQVALRSKITERIEYDDLASRKYAAWSLCAEKRKYHADGDRCGAAGGRPGAAGVSGDVSRTPNRRATYA